MFGKLTLDAIPYHEPIIMGAAGGVFLLIAAAAAAITAMGRWRWLWTEYITSVDHKKIGVMYMVVALLMLLRGFADAMMMRLQQALVYVDGEGFLPPHHYDQIFTAHGVIMIFFVAMPFLIGLMNIVVPLQIGARDVAYPFLNSLSFWLTVAGVGLTNVSLVIGEFAKTGWSGYPPLSGISFSPDVGVDYYIWALQLSGVGTLLTGINFFVTILRMRAPGMKLMDMPVFTWTALCTNVLIIAAFPILTVTLGLLSLDRYLGMHFFTGDGGGVQMMYVNLFWAWGHPEVYILILPAFGVFSEVTATFSEKRLFGYRYMVWALIAITVLSFGVWLHHFFTMGSGANVNAFFGIATMVIAIPTGVKVFNWLFTMYGGRLRFPPPMLWTIGFIITFSIGGMTGVLLSMPGADFVLHNSLFLIAHFHNVLIGGALFGYFAGLNYWFPKAFGFTLDQRLGKAAFWCWLVGFYLSFMPSYVLGFMGMTRRLSHPDNPDWRPWLNVSAVGMLVIGLGILLMVLQMVVSIRNRERNRDLTGDPWNGRTLEWAVPSPPPFYNFAAIPRVRGIDVWTTMKEEGRTGILQEAYADIHMPRNTAVGVAMGAFSVAFGFAMVWHIWWLAIAGAVGVAAAMVFRALDTNTDYIVPAAMVEKIERRNAEIAGRA